MVLFSFFHLLFVFLKNCPSQKGKAPSEKGLIVLLSVFKRVLEKSINRQKPQSQPTPSHKGKGCDDG
jgi:hypothetical protein